MLLQVLAWTRTPIQAILVIIWRRNPFSSTRLKPAYMVYEPETTTKYKTRPVGMGLDLGLLLG